MSTGSGTMAGLLRLAAVTIIAAFSASCAVQDAPPARHVNLSGYSAAFKRGYADGCDSVQAARRRDDRSYRNDADYRMGWNDGNSACRR